MRTATEVSEERHLGQDDENVEDQERPWEEASFGLDPHVLPQFDLLVSEGKISREFADRVIAERCAAGLPMVPAKLKPRPLPLPDNLAWLGQVGLADVGEAQLIRGAWRDELELAGRSWSFYSESSLGHISHHFHEAGQHSGWMSLGPGHQGEVLWDAYCIVHPSREPGDGNSITARQNGKTATLAEALCALDRLSWEPEIRSGVAWYPHEHNSRLAVVNGDMATVRELTYPGVAVEHRWRWERTHAAAMELGMFFDSRGFEGYASTREAAEAAALHAPQLLRAAAGRYLGDDVFEAGRKAGRAELKAQMLALDDEAGQRSRP